MRVRALLIVPALAGLAVFASTVTNPLLYDDPLAIEMAGLPSSELATRRNGLTYLTIKLDRTLWGPWPAGYHATNVLLHGLCSALVALSAASLGSGPRAAMLCGLLFAVHPVHSEVVASIENRKEMLALLFVLSSIILYRSRSRWCYIAALGCVALGMHAKEVAAVGVVVMLPLADLLRGRAHGADPPSPLSARVRRAARRALPLVVLGVLATGWYGGNVLETFAPGAIGRNVGKSFASYDEVLAASAAAIPDVGRLLVYPARLSVDYPAPVERRLTDARALAGVLILSGWIVATLGAARRAPLVAFGLAWTLIMYLPAANVVPLTTHFLAERYLYVPSFGFCLVVALGADHLLARATAGRSRIPRTLIVAVVVAMLMGGAARSALRTHDWRDAVSLWTAALEATPRGSGKIEGELGLALVRAHRHAEAIPHLQRALEIGPVETDFYNNLALALERDGRLAEALPYFERALASAPTNPLFRYNLGRTLVAVGRVEEGLAHLRIVAEPGAWTDLPPWVSAALTARGTSPEELRATLRKWLDAQDRHLP